jgi:predicted DNA-binding transcriptional regulator AlpA
MATKAALRQALCAAGVPPAGLSLPEAAAYVGLSPNTFLAEVMAGTLPPSIPLTKRRRLWSRAALDAAVGGRSNAAPIPLDDKIKAAIDDYAG